MKFQTIEDEVIFERPEELKIVMNLCEAFQPSSFSEESGEIERLRSEVDKLNETCGRLLAMLFVKGQINISEIKQILNFDFNFEISEIQDFD